MLYLPVYIIAAQNLRALQRGVSHKQLSSSTGRPGGLVVNLEDHYSV